MPDTPPATTTLPTVSDDTLEDVPARALKFLLAVGTSAPIRASLALRGYDQDDHDRGWARLHAVAGYAPSVKAPPPTSKDAAHAVKTIDDWDEDGFSLVRASWENSFPAQLDFALSGGLHAEKGIRSVLAVHTLLDRLDALESSPEREATRDVDHAAIALLAKRGLDAKERTRLRSLITQAEAFEKIAPTPDTTATKLDDRQKRLALYAWLTEWSQIARTVIKRRDHLIRMGLASPKKSKKDAPKP